MGRVPLRHRSTSHCRVSAVLVADLSSEGIERNRPIAVLPPWRRCRIRHILVDVRLNKAMARRIRELRDRRGWTQEELASQAGVDVRTVQRIEYGEGVRSTTLTKVTAALGRTPDDLKIEELQDQVAGLEEAVAPYRCPYCGSELVETAQVPLDTEEKVWDTHEGYACGYRTLAGEPQSLCPRDPEFPPLETFEFRYRGFRSATTSWPENRGGSVDAGTRNSMGDHWPRPAARRPSWTRHDIPRAAVSLIYERGWPLLLRLVRD